MQRVRVVLALALVAAAGAAGCSPANEMNHRIANLPEELYPVIRDAIWAHGNPYAWCEQKNVVIETHWSDFRHGDTPRVNHKVYTIDLKGRRMRIDDSTDQTVALYNGSRWRVFIQGQEIKKPGTFDADTAPYMAMLEYAASEMRVIRTLFCLPFNLVDDGVRLESKGRVRSMAGGSMWNVVRVTFDMNKTGYLSTDRLLVYFDPGSGCVMRVFTRLSGEPFYSMPFWGEWSDYRLLPNGLRVPRHWEFRRTDTKGGADRGRRLSISLKNVAFNVDLPWRLFDSPRVQPPALPEAGFELKPKQLGVDNVDS